MTLVQVLSWNRPSTADLVADAAPTLGSKRTLSEITTSRTQMDVDAYKVHPVLVVLAFASWVPLGPLETSRDYSSLVRSQALQYPSAVGRIFPSWGNSTSFISSLTILATLAFFPLS